MVSFTHFWQLCKPYWISNDKWAARKLLGLNIACILSEIIASIWLNNFNKCFFDALQNFDKTAILNMLPSYLFFLTILMLSFGYGVYFTGLLSIRWRSWLTHHYLSQWTSNHTHYQMQLDSPSLENPDQRISEDLEKFPALTLTLLFSLLHSVITLCAFSTILWGLSGTLEIPLFSFHLKISGYLCWSALLYAVIGTWFLYVIGKDLSSLNYFKERHNADFRFSMIRFREASAHIALQNSAEYENKYFSSVFMHITTNFISIVTLQKYIKIYNNTYKTISYVFGLFISMPLYFSKKILLGTVIQISGAFSTVITAFSVLIDSFEKIAEWQAVIFRLTEFTEMLAAHTTRSSDIKISTHQGETLLVKNLCLNLPCGKNLLQNLNFTFMPGSKILITGPSGFGKSTFLQALSGSWPYGKGHIVFPLDAVSLFISQKPHLPIGTLRDALLYPNEKRVSDSELISLLRICLLDKYIPQLNVINNWSNVLSFGELQQLTFVKIFLRSPQLVFLDEITSSLNEKTESYLYALLAQKLPQATVITVSHKNSLKRCHNVMINLAHSADDLCEYELTEK